MLSGLILAGGRSSRMGRDKAFLPWRDGRTLLERQVALLRAVGAISIQVSLRPGVKTDMPGVTCVHDTVPDAGPLAGIAAGLRAAPAGRVMVLAVDMGGLNEQHLRAIMALSTPERGVVPVVAGQLEPLAAVYPTSLVDSGEAALARGNGAVHAWARSAAETQKLLLWDAPADWAPAFRSWNAPADLPS